jgi:galactonate dehydratase
MDRRRVLTGAAAAAGAAVLPDAAVRAAAATAGAAPATRSDLKVTRVRVLNPAGDASVAAPLLLSEIVVAVDTDAGITGYGQGGTVDLLRYAGSLLIGQDPLRTEHLWQRMYRSSIYPAGRERLHAVGALDCALWDIKGKALGVPLYQLLGGRVRDHVDCYKSYGALSPVQAREEGRRTMAEGFRALRFHAAVGAGTTFDARRSIRAFTAIATALREAIGPDGEFIVDAHTRFDLADSVTLCQQLQPLSPLFVEDPLRTMDDLTLYAQLRQKVGVPLAAGEQFGDLRDGNLPLVEQGLIDFLRTSIPNCGGVTSFRKLMALCEAHSVAMVPHFTPPIATAAVVHALFAFPGQAMDEVYRPALPPYLNEAYRFRDGRMAASDRPGLGVVVDESRLRQVAEFTEARPPSLYQGESIQRPDGSHLYL